MIGLEMVLRYSTLAAREGEEGSGGPGGGRWPPVLLLKTRGRGERSFGGEGTSPPFNRSPEKLITRYNAE